jgi:hypothetical protein
MPRIPIDYSKSCVYRLIHKHTTYYVGSTTNFVKRKAQHKYDCNTENRKAYDFPLYKFVRETGGWEAWDMILIESYPECKTSEELRKYERFHYDIIRPELNLIRPYTTEEENKEYKIKYCKVYYYENRDNNRDKKKKQDINYYNNNREKIKEYQTEYRDNNYEKINEKKECECGGKYTHKHKAIHFKAEKHQAYLAGRVV